MSNNNKVVSIPRRMHAVFVRRDEHTIPFGLVVSYEMEGIFGISASRHGIEIEARTPAPVPPDAIDIFIRAMERAKRHHLHLKTFSLGVRQVALSEDEVKQNNPAQNAPQGQETTSHGAVQDPSHV